MNPEKYKHISRRLANAEDYGFARQAHHRAYRDVVVRQFGEWDENAQDKFFESGWSNSSHEIILCDGMPCGYCSRIENENSITLNELVLLPEFQGQGIGSAILSETIEKAKTENKPASLQVLKENRAAELYQRTGFKIVGETETHYKMEFDPDTLEEKK